MTDEYLLWRFFTKSSFFEKDLDATAIVSIVFKLLFYYVISKFCIDPIISLNVSNIHYILHRIFVTLRKFELLLEYYGAYE